VLHACVALDRRRVVHDYKSSRQVGDVVLHPITTDMSHHAGILRVVRNAKVLVLLTNLG
jgi:hypothetical protein